MSDLDAHFSPLAIINTLCKYRIKCATKGRKKHVLSELTNIPGEKEKLVYSDPFFDQVKEMMPPRSRWLRAELAERKMKDSTQIAIDSIRKRITITHYEVQNGATPPDWYIKLQSFVEKLKKRIENIETIKFQSPQIIPAIKEKKLSDDKKEVKETVCRPIAIFGLEDRIVIGLTAKYLLTLFENIFFDYSYAFKPIKYTGTDVDIIKHHDAIKEILRYKMLQHPKQLWVSECDINKFFDCVNHKITYKCFINGLKEMKEKGISYDNRIMRLFKEYLKCYSFLGNVSILNPNIDYWNSKNIIKGNFEFPTKLLKQKFYHADTLARRNIGIPQGGAISCFIANLLLHEADKKIKQINISDEDLFYCRYCDDMILMHPDKAKCDKLLITYTRALRKLKLIVHTPTQVVDYSSKKVNGKTAKKFWKHKSKLPYCWDSNKVSRSFVPWIGFVGYQIRHDGSIRVRKNSLEKEIKKQKKVIRQTLTVINANNKKDLNKNSKKSSQELITSITGRLNAMAIGKCNLYNAYSRKAQKLCWLNGFSEINKNPSSICQLKRLDRSKNRLLHELERKLIPLTKKSLPPPTPKPDDWEIKYYGHAFSYSKAFKVQ